MNNRMLPIRPRLRPETEGNIRNKARMRIAGNSEAYADTSDEWVSEQVRMLMPSDLDHESICVAGRDRIMRLSLQLKDLREAATQVVVTSWGSNLPKLAMGEVIRKLASVIDQAYSPNRTSEPRTDVKTDHSSPEG